ncbi:hypothetical protein TRFO_27528 [Tritrichomonas foetus]|uniref:Uncharacterized protein n=1 Tax=Tritrichomonas foetus TaxID=1144522 RepID=A0A1J4K1S4_9EUKA|nr:hypothetical protein TRFO_27528 [Tritrichomonas foetus]|eukprot:OHT04906.1 hypothetical protein TRFO_27528 [Tritrichomonas foetus]
MSLRFMIYGAPAAGKTCFFQTVTHGLFSEKHKLTDHVEFAEKKINIKGNLITIQLWDTPSEQQARRVAYNYVRLADGILLFYDTSSKESFHTTKKILQEIRESGVPKADTVPILLVGNKSDAVKTQELFLSQTHKTKIFESINCSEKFEPNNEKVKDKSKKCDTKKHFGNDIIDACVLCQKHLLNTHQGLNLYGFKTQLNTAQAIKSKKIENQNETIPNNEKEEKLFCLLSEEIFYFCSEMKLKHVEISVKNRINVSKVLIEMIKEITKKFVTSQQCENTLKSKNPLIPISRNV